MGGIVTFSLYLLTKNYWEQRFLLDKYRLGRLYNQQEDFPGALAEFEESEEDFGDIRRKLDPEDAMGALAARAMLHNSKGFALMKLEPPRTAQARREFVRAV